MIRASIIYAIITVLLAFIDAIRINIAKKKGKDNIDHRVSTTLAVIGILVIAVVDSFHFPHSWDWENIKRALLYNLILFLMCGFIRLLLFDPLLNLFRRERLDYESATTSSYVDNHSRPIGFWQKRLLGLLGWGGMIFIHWIIFHKL